MKILAYPKAPNPYQELLYAPLRRRGNTITYLNPDFPSATVNLFILMPLLLLRRVQGYKIFHLHWIYPFGLKNKIWQSKIAQLFLFNYFKCFLLFTKILGYKLIWTVHNVLPHEKQFTNDIFARIFLSRLCDAKIIHSRQNMQEMKKMNYNTKNIYTIPIGNYIDVYKNSLTKKQSRKILNLKNENFVILCFGRVEPYKGIEDLVEQFTKLNLSRTTLLIVGPCSNKLYQSKLLKYKKDNIIFKLTFISDENVQLYFNAADIVACPFKYITTSSTAILALSFGKSVIAPLIGNLVDIPRNAGFFYDIEDSEGLGNSILKSISHKDQLIRMDNNALNYAKTMSWDKIADKTYNVYGKAISG